MDSMQDEYYADSYLNSLEKRLHDFENNRNQDMEFDGLYEIQNSRSSEVGQSLAQF